MKTTYSDLVLPHLKTLERRAQKLCHSSDRADDLLQETLLKALDKWDSYDPGLPVLNWLRTIMSRTHYSACRRQATVYKTDYRDIARTMHPTASDDRLWQQTQNEEMKIVHACFAEVDVSYTTCDNDTIDLGRAMAKLEPVNALLVMQATAGHSAKEMSQEHNMLPSTVLSRIFRARALLQRELVSIV